MHFLKFLRLVSIAILTLAVSQTAVAFSWNPLDWFRSEEPSFELRDPTPEEQAEASALFQQALDRGERRSALRPLRQIIGDYPFTSYAPRALKQKGDVFLARNNFRRAFRNYQRVLSTYPQFEGFDEIVQWQFDLAMDLKDGRRGRLFFIFPGLRNPNLANQFFEVVIRNAPFSDLAPRSLFAISEIAVDRNRTEVAIDALDRLITFYPDHPLAEQGFFKMAQIYKDLITGPHYDQGSTIEAVGYFEDFLVLFPESEFVQDAEEGLSSAIEVLAKNKFLMGEFYYRYRRNDTAALVFFNEAITVGPQTQSADLARERIARIEAGQSRPAIGLRALIPTFGRDDSDDDAGAVIEARRAEEFERESDFGDDRL